jgi:hypothetical protein
MHPHGLTEFSVPITLAIFLAHAASAQRDGSHEGHSTAVLRTVPVALLLVSAPARADRGLLQLGTAQVRVQELR